MRKATGEEIRALRDGPDGRGGMQQCAAQLNAQFRLEHLEALRSRFGEIYTVDQCADAIREILDVMIEDAK